MYDAFPKFRCLRVFRTYVQRAKVTAQCGELMNVLFCELPGNRECLSKGDLVKRSQASCRHDWGHNLPLIGSLLGPVSRLNSKLIELPCAEIYFSFVVSVY